MDAKQLQEIKARTAQELTEDDYHNLKIADIAKIRMDSKRLVAEVERLQQANDYANLLLAKQRERADSLCRQISTLKRALELAIGNHTAKREQIERLADYFIKQAQEEQS